MKKLFLTLVALVALSLAAVALLAKQEGIFTPQEIPPSPLRTSPNTPKRVIGFLPYWQMGTVTTIDFSALTDVIYFGVHIDQEGNIVSGDQTRLKNHLAQLPDGAYKISVAVVLQDNEAIEEFLKSKDAQDQLLENLSLLTTNNPRLAGINFDVEYAGIPGKDTISGFSTFVANATSRLKSHNSQLTISVDITADAMKKSRLYDVETLAKSADYIVLMGYDFFRPTSSVAGPVAPLTGKEIYEYDVTSAISDFLDVVAPEKLVLGVPYYGWDFPTESEERGSFIEKRPDEAVALSSYKRTREMIAKGQAELRFDEDSQTPWLVYRDPETDGIRQIWFEDEKSLEKKYDLVIREGLSGIAIWALGYDGTSTTLSQLLKEKFKL